MALSQDMKHKSQSITIGGKALIFEDGAGGAAIGVCEKGDEDSLPP